VALDTLKPLIQAIKPDSKELFKAIVFILLVIFQVLNEKVLRGYFGVDIEGPAENAEHGRRENT
jgi:hypothetical protein